MNWMDWIVLGLVGVSILTGLMKGAIRTVFSLVGLALGLLIASRESGALAILLTRVVGTRLAGPLAFVVVFLGIGLVFALAGWLLRKIIEKLSLTWLDRIAGGAMGLLRGAAIVGVMAIVIEGFGGSAALRGARSYPYALRAASAILFVIPAEAKQRLHWDVVEKRIPEELRAVRNARDVI